MNLTLHLSPEIEARLKEQAVAAGKSLEVIALEVLAERLAASDDDRAAAKLPHDEWNKKFNEMLSGVPASDAEFVDDSRERIYEGRGE
jgi:uncharacterized protein (DUF2267 family)